VQFACRIENPERCIKQSVPIAVKNVKFRSNLMEADPYTAENAILNEGPREDIKLIAKIFGPRAQLYYAGSFGLYFPLPLYLPEHRLLFTLFE